MRRQFFPALGMLVVFSVITGLAYPLLVTGVAQAGFAAKANGSLVRVDGNIVGSKWIGQPFTAAKYFHPRPQVDGYVAGKLGGGVYSYGSNYGPLDPRLQREVRSAARSYRTENHLGAATKIPVDAVTSSGSGLDPHISVANAELQAPRVAAARNMAPAEVLRLVRKYTESRALGFVGEPGVNVLLLNLALDRT